MKHRFFLPFLLRWTISVILIFICTPVLAEIECDFKVGNICYNFRGDTEVSVTFGSCEHEYGETWYTSPYTGSVTIPPTVTYNAVTYKVTAVGGSAFRECGSLTSVSLPNTITSIGPNAFCDCNSLTSVTIPQTVTTIGTGAFDGCVALSSIKIPDGVKTIDNSTFADCRALSYINIPSSVTVIGTSAFSGCSNLSTISIPDGVISVGANAFYGTPWYNNQPDGLVYVGKVAYKYKGNMPENTSIAIEDGTTEITADAFNGCTGLSSITIPDGVTTIGSSAFLGCTNLTSADIPEGVTTIGSSAFKNCTSLKAITIPKSVTSMGGVVSTSAFAGCSALKDVTILCPNIGNYWFREVEAIERIVFGDEVKTIGISAFYFCKGITSIKIPESVTNIYSGAFSMCTSLASITIKNSPSIAYDAFLGTPWIDNQPDGMIYIGQIAYRYKGEMPEGTNIILKDGTIEIGEQALASCSGLASISIPNSVRTIGNNAFYGCGSLESISLPEGIEKIGNNAFEYCRGLLSANIPGSVTSIGSSVFSYCEKMTSVEMSDGIKEIGTSMFSNCKNLASVVVPASVKNIANYAFNGCSRLTSIVIPGLVSSIGNSAFKDCTSLTDIFISEGVKTIGNDAFRGCNGLTSVTIPSTVDTIGDAAFTDCSIKTVMVNVKEPISIKSSVFSYYSNYQYYSYASLATLYVPFGSKTAYEAANYWKDFKEIVELEPEPVPVISINFVSARRGKTATIAIDLANESENLTAFQFDLTLPDGITLAKNDKGKYQVSKTSRFTDENQSLNVTLVEGSTYRVLCFSMENGVISGNTGAVLNAMLQVSREMSEGQYQGKIENIVFTKTDGTVLKQSNTTFDIEIKNVIPGDANDDEEVNVGDIVEIVSYIMGSPSLRFVIEAADCNGDGEINVGDIVAVVSIIMNTNISSSPAFARRTQEDLNMLWLRENNGKGLSLCMENGSGYVAAQMDVCLDKGQTLDAFVLNSALKSSHLMTCQKTGCGNYRIVIYSMDNEAFAHVGDELLTLQVSGGNVEVKNILFVTSAQDIMNRPAISYATTDIKSTIHQQQPAIVYDLQGHTWTGKQMQKGIYIINGKKQVVK